MLQLKKILVPRDFSPCSEQALQHALDLAGRTGAEVHLLFAEVLYADVQALTAKGRDAAQEALRERLMEGIEQEGEASGVRFETAVVRDIAPAPAIVAYAEEQDIDLILMGTHGRRGLRRLLLDSTAEEVVRTAPCPVFTVRRPETPVAGLEGVNAILVPIDFSRHAQTALRHAKELAALYHTRLDLLHVIEEQLHPAFYNTGVWSIYDLLPNIEEKAAEELRTFYRETEGPDVDMDVHVRYGHAAHEIAVFARKNDNDLVVMATHGLRGLDHFLLGSVAEKVVRRSPAPVFTVKAFGKALVPESVRVAAEATE